MALGSANLLSKTPEIYGKSPDEDAERSFEHLIDVALTEAPAGVVRELARFAGTAVTMLAFRAGVTATAEDLIAHALKASRS